MCTCRSAIRPLALVMVGPPSGWHLAISISVRPGRRRGAAFHHARCDAPHTPGRPERVRSAVVEQSRYSFASDRFQRMREMHANIRHGQHALPDRLAREPAADRLKMAGMAVEVARDRPSTPFDYMFLTIVDDPANRL